MLIQQSNILPGFLQLNMHIFIQNTGEFMIENDP